MKKKQSFQIAVATLGLLTTAVAHAQTQLPSTRQILDRNGQGFAGHSVSISGEWAAVGNPDLCIVDIYRFDYLTGLWGNGAGTVGLPFQEIDFQGNCTTANYRGFGAALELEGDVLIVGAPRAKQGRDEIGAFYIYTFSGGTSGTWGLASRVFQPQGRGSTPPQADARFGAAVAIASLAQNPDVHILIIGIPGFDGTAGADSGAAYTYSWLASSPSDAIADQVLEGENAGDALGTSVAASGIGSLPLFAVGAPFYDSAGFSDDGAVYIATPIFGRLQKLDVTDATVGNATWQSRWYLGAHVALSGDRLMVAGIWSYTFEDDPGTTATDFSLVQRIGPTEGATLAKDVSIGGGTKAYGVSIADRILIYDETAATGDPVGANVPFEGESSYATDIDIETDRVVVNGEQSNRAYAYTFPCGGGPDRLEHMTWEIVSIPCGPPSGGYTVEQVFADLGTIDVDYQVWQQNRTDWSGRAAANVKLGPQDQVFQDRSYWVIWRDVTGQSTEKIWGVNAAANPQRTPLQTAFANSPAFGDVAGHLFLTSSGTGTLPTGLDNGGDPVSVMLPNPFPKAFDASRLLVVEGNSGLVTLGSATSKLYIEDAILWVYDTVNPDIPSGQNYRAVVPTATPGFSATIEPYQGYWLKFLPAATQPSLLIPLEK
jgi:hypothetical protein